MKQALVLLLEKDERVEAIRRTYDPRYPNLEPHLTLVYPFEAKDREVLHRHVLNALRGFRPFGLSLRGFQPSAHDNYLYLLVEKGQKTVMKLHEKLNGGLLKGCYNPDMPRYLPHVTVGIFSSRNALLAALQNLEQHPFVWNTTIYQVHLLTLTDDNALVKQSAFSL